MQENASASQAAPEENIQNTSSVETDYSQDTQKRPNFLVLGLILVFGALVVVSAFFIVRTIRSRQLADQSDQVNLQENQDSSPASLSENLQVYLDPSNRFRLSYPSGVSVLEEDIDGVVFKQESTEILKIIPEVLSESTVKEYVDLKTQELGVDSGILEIAMIGSRAGYFFEYQDKKYMFFPLSFDSVLEIEAPKNAAEGVDLEAIIQSIEFLPLAQTS